MPNSKFEKSKGSIEKPELFRITVFIIIKYRYLNFERELENKIKI